MMKLLRKLRKHAEENWCYLTNVMSESGYRGI